jgi:hypothetical protein
VCVYYCSTYYKTVRVWGGGGQWRTGTREEPGNLTQGGALFSLIPLVWESNPKLQGDWCKTLPPSSPSWDLIPTIRGSGACVLCVCVFITAGPSTKLFAWEGGGYGRTCATKDDEPRPVWTRLPIMPTQGVCVCVCLLLQDLVQCCLHGGGGGYGRTCATRDDEPRPVWTLIQGRKCMCFCVCVFYYCRTYYKAVRVGEEESGGHVL